MEKLKLNLGSGSFEIEDYVNIDIKNGRQAYPLDYPDDSIDIIRASHLLEHFPMAEVFKIVKHWVDKLTPNGVLKIAVPDFKQIAENYLAGKDEQKTAGYIMGSQVDETEFHKCVFDKEFLINIMLDAGLTEIKRWNDHVDTCRLPISLNLMGIKPNLPLDVTSIESKGSPEIIDVKRKIACVVSMPRIGFTQNMRSMIRELSMRGIAVKIGTGAFWHQVLTTIIEEELESKPDFVLTLDYDTWFKYDQIVEMMEMMELSDADAIVPMQVKRESKEILLKADKTTMTRADYETGLMPIATGHFGCTLFRASAFENLKRPWFLPVPGPDGRWGDGRTDADIYFWQNYIACGLKVYLATQIRLGHLQQVCTFPGKFEDDLAPVHCYINDIEAGNVPDFM